MTRQPSPSSPLLCDDSDLGGCAGDVRPVWRLGNGPKGDLWCVLCETHAAEVTGLVPGILPAIRLRIVATEPERMVG